MYKLLIRPLFFLVDPEVIHRFTFNFLKLAMKLPLGRPIARALFCVRDPRLRVNLMGIEFQNRVGLAAGFDKDAKEIDELADVGFGFLEIGTLTPKPQSGNEKPRLFRLPMDEALINRMGFNNEGVHAAAERLKKRRSGIIVGGNIGKNKSTSMEAATEDYVACFHALYPHVDYFVVNVSSPNTPNLRDLQEKEPLRHLLSRVKVLSQAQEKIKPVLLKIAPDLTTTQLDDVIEIVKNTGTDGIIATNTTISRDGLATSRAELEKIGAGGLSGRPLARRSNEVIAYLRQGLGAGFPIIGVGGIMTVEDALDKLKAGADLIQIYTGFVYEGPGFVGRILRRLVNLES